MSALAADNEHLVAADIDLQPRVEAFWSLGGIEPDKRLKKIRKEDKHYGGEEEDPIDRPMQYKGKPSLSLRNGLPLPQFCERDSGLSIEGNVPQWNYDPRVLGYKYKLHRASNTPGKLLFVVGFSLIFYIQSLSLRKLLNCYFFTRITSLFSYCKKMLCVGSLIIKLLCISFKLHYYLDYYY